MLDRFILSKLNSTGKVAYFIGQIALIIVWAIYFFGPMGGSMNDDSVFIFGILGIVIVWAIVCLMVWPEGKDEDYDDVKNIEEETRFVEE